MRWALFILAAGLGACGGDTSVLVEVDLTAYAVTADVDTVHLELADGDEVLGRTFTLSPGTQRPTFELLPGPRTPPRMALTAFAYLGATLVGQSSSVEVVVRDGETTTVKLAVP